MIWKHCVNDHEEMIPPEKDDRAAFRESYLAESFIKQSNGRQENSVQLLPVLETSNYSKSESPCSCGESACLKTPTLCQQMKRVQNLCAELDQHTLSQEGSEELTLPESEPLERQEGLQFQKITFDPSTLGRRRIRKQNSNRHHIRPQIPKYPPKNMSSSPVLRPIPQEKPVEAVELYAKYVIAKRQEYERQPVRKVSADGIPRDRHGKVRWNAVFDKELAPPDTKSEKKILPFGRGLYNQHKHQDMKQFKVGQGRTNTRPRENRRKVLRILINNEEHLACPDSGSVKNIISETCANKHNLRIRRRPQDIKRFEVGNGDIVWSVGRVKERVIIPGHPLDGKKRFFYVIANCPVPVVLGIDFLREAEILTVNRHFLETCPEDMSRISSLLWIGSPRNRMRCTIDGRQLEGMADTGSDLNFISLACANREGFQIDRRKKARSLITVGNGAVIETVGQVYVSNLGLDWREPETEATRPPLRPPQTEGFLGSGVDNGTDIPVEKGEELEAIFHVLQDLPCDIVFGSQLLEDTDAFNKCPELLFVSPKYGDDLCGEQPFAFNIFRRKNRLKWFSSRKKAGSDSGVDLRGQHEDDWHAELGRRSRFTEEKIAMMPVAKQQEARRTEREKVRIWVVAHSQCVHCSAV